jgi:hypothetical protein
MEAALNGGRKVTERIAFGYEIELATAAASRLNAGYVEQPIVFGSHEYGYTTPDGDETLHIETFRSREALHLIRVHGKPYAHPFLSMRIHSHCCTTLFHGTLSSAFRTCPRMLQLPTIVASSSPSPWRAGWSTLA